MINELIKQLKALKPGKGQFTVGDTVIDYDITDNGYTISMVSGVENNKQDDAEKAASKKAATIKKEISEYVEKFKDDMKQIDDEVFAEACEQFNKFSSFSLNDLSKACDRAIDFNFIKNGITMFKRNVNSVIEKKIIELKKQIQNI